MPLMQYELLMPAQPLEAWSDALLAAGAVSVCIEDADSQTPDEVALYGEPGLIPEQAGWKNNRVSILIEAEADFKQLVESISRAHGLASPGILQCTPVAECDWVSQTQAQFAPIQIGRVWIVPSWHEPPDPRACNIRIDPGAAFGTGTHPTTRLCLAWMEQRDMTGLRVLDYGCGSGILSICAALLGAHTVLGVDIDAQALATAQANARRNGVVARYTQPEGLQTSEPGSFDLVVANILANPIVLLAPTLVRHVAPGGAILLSGVLERQAEQVLQAYRQAEPSLQIHTAGQDEGWVAICGTRPGAVTD